MLIEGPMSVQLLGGVAGLLGLAGIRELGQASPSLVRWAKAAVEPLARAGSEGYRPSRPELRRLALFGAMVTVLFGSALFGALIALPLAVAVSALARWAVGQRRARYRRRFELALPEIANAIADSVSAGHSLRSALVELTVGLRGSSRAEMAVVAIELELGGATGAVIAQLGRRLGSARVEAFAAALIAGRDSGGDLADLMRRFAEAAEAHDRAEREARVATAQARFTGILVVAMPCGAALFTELLSPGFLRGLFASPVSLVMVSMAVALQVLGFFAIRRLSRQVG